MNYGELELVDVKELRPSPFNRREHYGNLKTFGESLAREGVLQPLRVRKVNGYYELVFGHRRLAAAVEAGIPKLPVIVCRMTDDDVIDAQITENIEREDMHPMDEAELFGQLLERKLSVEDIANRRGCEQEYVRSRTKLLSLAKPVRKMFVGGKFGAEVAFVIARIPDPKLQKKAADDMTNRHMPIDVDEARRLVRREYMLDLRSAPFDVADGGLVPKMKSCASCPERTGQQRELFGEIKKRDDLCLDPKCWADKAAAAWKIKSAAARKDGLKVLGVKDSKDAFNAYHHGGADSYYGLAYNSGFVDADAETVDYRLKDKNLNKSWAKLLGDALPEITLAKDPGGSPRRLVNRKAAERALRKVGLVKTEKKATSPAAQGKQARKTRLIKKETAKKIIEQLGLKAATTTFGKDSKLLQVLAYLGNSAHHTEVAQLHDEKEKDFARSLLSEPDGYKLLKYILEGALFDWFHDFGYKGYGSEFITACEHLGVDVLAIEKEIADEKKAAAKPKKKAKAKKPAAKKTRAKK
jgi:ParB/RepB/Spo0J family partition protein